MAVPPIDTRKLYSKQDIYVAVDGAGCPARCRHCWLGGGPNGSMSVDDIRSVFAEFRDWSDSCEDAPPLRLMTWYREPDFAPHYRDLYALEGELSDGEQTRYDLLSIWRLARDESYAGWAREIGTEACQITFFGMEETTDWFVRRKGAFRDNLLATERCLAVGIRPRWQFFLTKRAIPELADFVDLV